MKKTFFYLVVLVAFLLFSCEENSKTRPKEQEDPDESAVTDVDMGTDEETVDEATDIAEENDEHEVDDDPEIQDTNDDFQPVDNEVPDQDINEVPDDPEPVDLCQTNEDCVWQYICDIMLDPNECIKFGQCESDEDCTAMQVCVAKEHWKECVTNTSPDFCDGDDDCDPGEYCLTDGLLKICRSKNECSDNSQCPEGHECLFEDDYYHCIDTSPCEVNEDCQFGYMCEIKQPENECVYASECVSDEDCDGLAVCVAEGNWTVCKLTGGGICSGDADCDITEYCDLEIGIAGRCKSRNQCYSDEDCGDERLKCENNGVYNECVPKNPNWCLLDDMCDEGWYCIENECRPPYYEQCSEIAGEWKVWFSELSAVAFQQDEVYEFVPTDGCNGKILKDGADTLNKFSQTSPGNYDLDFYLIYQCTATVVLGNLMNIHCADGDAQLGKFQGVELQVSAG